MTVTASMTTALRSALSASSASVRCRRTGLTVCGADEPVDDGDGVTCNVRPGPTQNERCNNLDDDCDGRVDEEIGKGDNCSVGRGICERNGINVCAEDGSVVCNAVAGEPLDIAPADGIPDELCNRADDDCDGSIDEGNPEGGADCPTGNRGICSIGTLICKDDGTLECVPDAEPGQFEELCNNRDDDCDGLDDEGNPEANQPCQTGLVGVCADGTTQCVAGNVECIQISQSSPEFCDGLNNV